MSQGSSLTLLCSCSVQHRRKGLEELLELEWVFWSNQSPCKFCSSNFNGESKFPGRVHASTFIPQLLSIQVTTHVRYFGGGEGHLSPHLLGPHNMSLAPLDSLTVLRCAHGGGSAVLEGRALCTWPRRKQEVVLVQ